MKPLRTSRWNRIFSLPWQFEHPVVEGSRMDELEGRFGFWSKDLLEFQRPWAASLDQHWAYWEPVAIIFIKNIKLDMDAIWQWIRQLRKGKEEKSQFLSHLCIIRYWTPAWVCKLRRSRFNPLKNHFRRIIRASCKGDSTREHCMQKNSQTPNITGHTIALHFQNLWKNKYGKYTKLLWVDCFCYKKTCLRSCELSGIAGRH